MPLLARRADITTLAVDAVVTAANAGLRGGGGVDGAVHRAAGPELLAACRAIGGCRTGDAVVTPGFRLQARWVIHAVGPVWRGGGAGEPALLASAYRAALARLREVGGRSIAFPAISTGVYGYPPDLAAPLAIAIVREALAAHGPLDVIFVCFDAATLALYDKELSE
ncbi:O-acetyl-ADP-ribose deacetylase [Paracraurococcus lichenis]|uniref:O-acetyl-ADP-ribose deacetylase n=1 Tax=Paracraurococcus lichenis TaxID=3064888 RepID=A0ABT9DVK6_9PROT|nr:O-acetyl-ADP-ribose deacetylase [Paracraurococcus sp. LOR1-02]MDO9707935.1 O-acetyl-ADP-ribose deacetylase [Paracraurococcus sp. LOR1-02]